MSRILYPALELGRDETPTSYVSRLARLHRLPSLKQFCIELGMPLQALSDGTRETLTRLSDLTGIPTDTLAGNTIQRQGAEITFRGEQLRKQSLATAQTRICPHCLLQDRAAAPELGDLAAYGRVLWRLETYQTCLQHHVRLACIPYKHREIENHNIRHDFHAVIEPTLAHLVLLTADVVEHPPSRLEQYVANRFATGRSPERWLDTLPYYVVIEACEIFGGVAHHGPNFVFNSLTKNDWARAGEAGYDILKDGPQNITRFLDDLSQSYHQTRRRLSSRYGAYGHIYRWLCRIGDHPDVLPFRQCVETHLVGAVGIGLGRGVFGRPVKERVLHTIRSASLDFNLEPRRLRRVLALSGLISPEQTELPDDLVTFDTKSSDTLLRDLVEGLTLGSAAERIGATRPEVNRMKKAKILNPILIGGKHTTTLKNYTFRRSDVEGFLTKLFASFDPSVPCPGRPAPLRFAKKSAMCGDMTIISLILERRLKWVGSTLPKPTFSSLLVDAEEVRGILLPKRDGTLTSREVRQRIGIKLRHMERLVEDGYLDGKIQKYSSKRKNHLVIYEGSLRSFESKYMTIVGIAKKFGVWHFELQAALQKLHPEHLLPAAIYGKHFCNIEILSDELIRSCRAREHFTKHQIKSKITII